MSDFPAYNNGNGDCMLRQPGMPSNIDLYQYSGEQIPQGANLPISFNQSGNQSGVDLYNYGGEGQPNMPSAGRDLYQYSGDQQAQGDPFANDRMPGVPGQNPTYRDVQTDGQGDVIINNYYCQNAYVNENGGYDYRTDPTYDYRRYLPSYANQQQLANQTYYPGEVMPQQAMTPALQSELARQQALMSVYNRAFNPQQQQEQNGVVGYNYPPQYRQYINGGNQYSQFSQNTPYGQSSQSSQNDQNAQYAQLQPPGYAQYENYNGMSNGQQFLSSMAGAAIPGLIIGALSQHGGNHGSDNCYRPMPYYQSSHHMRRR